MKTDIFTAKFTAQIDSYNPKTLAFSASVKADGETFALAGKVWNKDGDWIAAIDDQYHGEGETMEFAVCEAIRDYLK